MHKFDEVMYGSSDSDSENEKVDNKKRSRTSESADSSRQLEEEPDSMIAV